MKIDKRKLKLQKLLLKIEGGEDIALRELKSVLTDNEYLQFQNRWEHERSNRHIEKPDEIKHYEMLLKKAVFADSKLDVYSARSVSGKKVKINVLDKLSLNSEIALFKAVEYLESIYLQLRCWFDRDIEFDGLNSPSDVAQLPRVITSRGSNVETQGLLAPVTKREIKKESLENSLFAIENPTPLLTEDEQWEELKKTFAKTKKCVLDAERKSKFLAIKV
jgi:hypothetical protein